MKCDFCREEISNKPYVIYREINTLNDKKSRAKMALNFCSRTCMIAEKIFVLLFRMSEDMEPVPERDELLSIVKSKVMRITSCTEEEYEAGLKRFNECAVVFDKNDMEKYL